jgi:hypothetical protein
VFEAAEHLFVIMLDPRIVDLLRRSYTTLVECPLGLFRARKRNSGSLYDAPSLRAVARR